MSRCCCRQQVSRFAAPQAALRYVKLFPDSRGGRRSRTKSRGNTAIAEASTYRIPHGRPSRRPSFEARDAAREVTGAKRVRARAHYHTRECKSPQSGLASSSSGKERVEELRRGNCRQSRLISRRNFSRIAEFDAFSVLRSSKTLERFAS